MNVLVGYTGFVGSNIYEKGEFDKVFNSKNILDAYGLEPDLLIYAGMRAEKFLANNDPEKDMKLVLEAEENIKKIAPKKLVLISTIDVYKEPIDVDENSFIDTDGLNAYGYNRYVLECWVRENFPDALIIRLPGLFGKNLKKNFIYDYINLIPSMLKENKYNELLQKDNELRLYYNDQGNGFYKCIDLDRDSKEVLKNKFKKLGFTALNFTDSRSIYQFYPLDRLWKDINIALENGILMWNPATEPISAGELYKYLTGNEFNNELPGKPANYDYRTIYGELFGGNSGYISDKDTILRSIKEVIEKNE